MAHLRPGAKIEVRSIDYVPRSERHGKTWHQGPFWFTGNFLFGTLLTGFIGPSLGLPLSWAVLAILAGVAFGTFFMAFHANQGPTMGLPQMIQSRAQFGVRGAIVPLAAAIFSYAGFAIFGIIFVADAVQATLSIDPAISYVVMCVLATAIAIFGYDALHVVMRWLTYLVIPVYFVISIIAVTTLEPQATAGGGTFTLWLLQFGVSAGVQVSYAVYVSDYSRYLPAGSSSRSLITWTYLGASTSAAWMMALGALIAASVPGLDGLSVIEEVGDKVFSGFGAFAILAIVPSTIGAAAIAFYSATLCFLSVLEAFRPTMSTGRTFRSTVIVCCSTISLIVIFALPDSYLSSFSTFLQVLLYILVPWTAVNLVDFYLVRHGHYAITEIFESNGLYGRWGARGLIAYAVGFVAMVPFMAVSFYTGPIATALDGADVAFIVGLVVSGICYYVLMRSFDPSTEVAAIAKSDRALEGSGTSSHVKNEEPVT